MRVIDGIRDWLNQKSGVQMVADDPQLAAEVLLLLRVMFADGEMNEQELSLFKQLCKSVFEVDEKDVPEVIRFLKDVSYETSSDQAAHMFQEMPEKRKSALLSHLLMMAMADETFKESEKEIIRRVALAMGYSEEQVLALV